MVGASVVVSTGTVVVSTGVAVVVSSGMTVVVSSGVIISYDESGVVWSSLGVLASRQEASVSIQLRDSDSASIEAIFFIFLFSVPPPEAAIFL